MSEDPLSLVNCTSADPDAVLGSQRVNELRVLKAVTIASGTLSVLGSCFLILAFHLTRTHRSLGFRIVYWLSFADLLSSLIYMIDGASPLRAADYADDCPGVGGFCIFKGAVSQFANLSAVLWTLCIAINLQVTLLNRSARAAHSPEHLLRSMHLGVWLSSFATTLLLAATGSLGAAGQWCWIAAHSQWARLVFYYMPLLCTVAYNFTVYWKTRSTFATLHRQASVQGRGGGGGGGDGGGGGGDGDGGGGGGGGASVLPELTSRLRGLILIFVIVHTPQILNRLNDLFWPASPSFAIRLVHSALGPLQGLGNALVYGWTPRVRRLYASRFPRIFGCWVAEPTSIGGGRARGAQLPEVQMAPPDPELRQNSPQLSVHEPGSPVTPSAVLVTERGVA